MFSTIKLEFRMFWAVVIVFARLVLKAYGNLLKNKHAQFVGKRKMFKLNICLLIEIFCRLQSSIRKLKKFIMNNKVKMFALNMGKLSRIFAKLISNLFAKLAMIIVIRIIKASLRILKQRILLRLLIRLNNQLVIKNNSWLILKCRLKCLKKVKLKLLNS
jgi:hypothetical protein